MARRVVASCVDLSDETRFEVHIIIQLSYDLSDSKTILRPGILTLTSTPFLSLTQIITKPTYLTSFLLGARGNTNGDDLTLVSASQVFFLKFPGSSPFPPASLAILCISR